MKTSVFIVSLITTILIGSNFALPTSDSSKNSANQEMIPPLLLPGPGSVGPHNLKLKVTARMDTLPSEMDIFQFVKKKITEHEVDKVAKKLGINGSVKKNELINALTVSEGTKYLEVEDGTGAILYVNRERADLKEVNGKPKAVPSDNESIRYATEFLNSMNWLPNNFKIVDITENREVPGNLNPDTDKGFLLSKSIHFYQHINNQPVLGVSRIVVEVGHNGEIEVVRKYHKEHTKSAKYNTKKVDQAIHELQMGKGIHNIQESEVDETIVTNVEVSYWEDAGTIEEQPYLQPVYVMTGSYKKNGKERPFQAVVPAINDQHVMAQPDHASK